jgi:hypothetical protein
VLVELTWAPVVTLSGAAIVVKIMVVSGRVMPALSVAPDIDNMYAVPFSKESCDVMKASIPSSAGTTWTGTFPTDALRVTVLVLRLVTFSGSENRKEMS